MQANHGVTYQKVWRYKLAKDYRLDFAKDHGQSLVVLTDCQTRHYSLTATKVFAWAGYSWDGASGPVVQTKNSVRATLVHDIMYQAMASGGVPATRRNRKIADRIFLAVLKEDGMTWARRRAWHLAVRLLGAKDIKSENRA